MRSLKWSVAGRAPEEDVVPVNLPVVWMTR